MATPVLFIHGLWLHATSWEPWMHLFRDAGYEPYAPSWPGDGDTVEASRANPEAIGDHGIDDITEHFARIIDGLPSLPVLIGHSFGGMIAQKLLGQDWAAAAIAIDAAQIKGVLPVPLPALKATLPVFRNPANKHRAVSLTAEQFRFAFASAVPRALRALDNPSTGTPAVRGGGRQLQPALAGAGRHGQPEPRTAAADNRR